MINDHYLQANPSVLSLILLSGMEEVMGIELVNSLLDQCRLPLLNTNHLDNHTGSQIWYENLSNIRSAIEDRFGPRSGRGLTLCSGRESFKYGLRLFGKETGLLDSKFRLQPTTAKMRTGLATLAELISQMIQTPVHLEEKKDRFIWQMKPCPLCWEEPSGVYTCPTITGMLQAFLYWASGGKNFQVGNIPIASSEAQLACILSIDKLAFD